MKPRVYFVVLLLVIPFQASLIEPISLGGIKPDIALAALFIIGLLTGPTEAAIAGMAIGLVQDVGSASFIGFSAMTRGLVGLAAGLLGSRILDLSSPVIILFLAVFSLAEGILIALFLSVTYGDVPVLSMLGVRMLPQALYTSILGLLLLKFVSNKNNLPLLMRRNFQKE